MIIRAASDSDSDELGTPPSSPKTHRSVFDPPTPVNLSAGRSAPQYLWLVLCGLLVLLLLLDLAALFSPVIDAFGLLPLALAITRSDTDVLVPSPASSANQLVGVVLISVWVYSRESSLGGQSSRYGVYVVLAMLALGHIISCLYLLFALFESNGDRSKFWLGRRHAKKSNSPYGRV